MARDDSCQPVHLCPLWTGSQNLTEALGEGHAGVGLLWAAKGTTAGGQARRPPRPSPSSPAARRNSRNSERMTSERAPFPQPSPGISGLSQQHLRGGEGRSAPPWCVGKLRLRGGQS